MSTQTTTPPAPPVPLEDFAPFGWAAETRPDTRRPDVAAVIVIRPGGPPLLGGLAGRPERRYRLQVGDNPPVEDFPVEVAAHWAAAIQAGNPGAIVGGDFRLRPVDDTLPVIGGIGGFEEPDGTPPPPMTAGLRRERRRRGRGLRRRAAGGFVAALALIVAITAIGAAADDEDNPPTTTAAADDDRRFRDVPADYPLLDDVEFAATRGWFKGDNGLFNPDKKITNKQLAAVINRIFNEERAMTRAEFAAFIRAGNTAVNEHRITDDDDIKIWQNRNCPEWPKEDPARLEVRRVVAAAWAAGYDWGGKDGDDDGYPCEAQIGRDYIAEHPDYIEPDNPPTTPTASWGFHCQGCTATGSGSVREVFAIPEIIARFADNPCGQYKGDCL